MPVTHDFDSMDPWLQHELILEDVTAWCDEVFDQAKERAVTPEARVLVENLRVNVREQLYQKISQAGQQAVEVYQEKHAGPCSGGKCGGEEA